MADHLSLAEIETSFFSDENKDFKRHKGTPSKAENNVAKALKELRQEGVIAHFLRAWRNRQLDVSGIDFLIIFEGGVYDGWAIPLQVKTKKGELDTHFSRYPSVKAVIVTCSHDTIFQTKEKLLELFERMKNLREENRYVVVNGED